MDPHDHSTTASSCDAWWNTATVACPADAVAPTPPAVNDNCGRPLTVSAPVVTGSAVCSGDITYTYTYTDCANANYTWTHTITVLPPVVVMPGGTTATVACPADAVAPTPPAVNDNCGRPLTVSDLDAWHLLLRAAQYVQGTSPTHIPILIALMQTMHGPT